MADVVLNHKAAADRLESFQVIEVDQKIAQLNLENLLPSMVGQTLLLMEDKTSTMISTGTGTISLELTMMPKDGSLVFTLSREIIRAGPTRN